MDTANDIINNETIPRDGLDLWGRFRCALNGIRSKWRCNPLVSWIKGHTNESDVVKGIISQEERNGNSAADALASEAAISWKCPDAISILLDKNRKAGRLVQDYQVEVLLMRLQAFKERYEVTEVT